MRWLLVIPLLAAPCWLGRFWIARTAALLLQRLAYRYCALGLLRLARRIARYAE